MGFTNKKDNLDKVYESMLLGEEYWIEVFDDKTGEFVQISPSRKSKGEAKRDLKAAFPGGKKRKWKFSWE